MNATPSRIAVQPAPPRRAGSPAPTAWPTRTAPAEASPSGTMNATAAMLSAIWCEAAATGASSPGECRRRRENADLERHG